MPNSSTCPSSSGTRPTAARTSVDLPEPLAPEQGDELTLGHVEVDLSQDRSTFEASPRRRGDRQAAWRRHEQPFAVRIASRLSPASASGTSRPGVVAETLDGVERGGRAPVSRATVSAIAGLTSSSVKIVVMSSRLHQVADVGELGRRRLVGRVDAGDRHLRQVVALREVVERGMARDDRPGAAGLEPGRRSRRRARPARCSRRRRWPR